MADEKSIYERWSEERLDPPFPKEWGLDKEDEAELLWPIWPLLFMGESDTEQYVETITDYVMGRTRAGIRWGERRQQALGKARRGLRGRAPQVSSCLCC